MSFGSRARLGRVYCADSRTSFFLVPIEFSSFHRWSYDKDCTTRRERLQNATESSFRASNPNTWQLVMRTRASRRRCCNVRVTARNVFKTLGRIDRFLKTIYPGTAAYWTIRLLFRPEISSGTVRLIVNFNITVDDHVKAEDFRKWKRIIAPFSMRSSWVVEEASRIARVCAKDRR